MSNRKNVSYAVKDIVEALKKNPAARFSKTDFQTLVYAVLSDKEFKAKKYLLKGGKLEENEVEFNSSMRKFMDKLLLHAGITEAAERAYILDTFEYTPKDVEWITDAVDEAMYLYAESDKNMRIFRDKMLQLTIRKMKRSGKHSGKTTYKKVVVDRSPKEEVPQ